MAALARIAMETQRLEPRVRNSVGNTCKKTLKEESRELNSLKTYKSTCVLSVSTLIVFKCSVAVYFLKNQTQSTVLPVSLKFLTSSTKNSTESSSNDLKLNR